MTLVTLAAVAGCGSTTLPYKPEVQPRGARVSAAYQVVADRVGIEIDTDGRRLEQAWIMKGDNEAIPPDRIDAPPLVTGPPSTFNIGLGGGSYGSGVGVGTGVGVGIPVGEGSTRVAGNTFVWFPSAAVGPPPWRLYVKVAGAEPTTFTVGGASTPSTPSTPPKAPSY
jgi:hypothetical protein